MIMISKGSVFAVSVTLLAVAGPSAATEAGDLATLFTKQATVSAAAGRFVRLELPAAVLAECRADLSDVRIFDRRDQIVPFAIDRGEAAADGLEIVRSIPVAPIAVSQHTSQPKDGPPHFIERYELEVPEAARDIGPWRLIVGTRQPRFVRAATLAVGDDTIASGSIFRLLAPRRERLRLDVGDLSDLGDRRLSLSLEGENAGFLEPDLRFQHLRQVTGRSRAEIVLEEIGRESQDGRTTIVVERPDGIVPDLLRLRTTTPSLARDVTVWDEGPDRVDDRLGRGRIARSPTAETDETLEVPIAAPRGDRLRIVIEDGDSPMLEELEIAAAVRMPALVFALPGSEDTEAVATLRFGGGQARRPRFDELALDVGPDASGASPAQALRRGHYDPGRLRQASLGAITANPDYHPRPAFALAGTAGAVVDSRRFRHRSTISAPASVHSLVRVSLDIAALAAARSDLGDLRIIDAEGNQRPYLLARGRHEWQEIQVSAPEVRDRSSIYQLELPAAPVSIDQLSLAPQAPFFDRGFMLSAITERESDRVVASGRMSRTVGDPRPWRIDLPAARLQSLRLRVDDGNDAPLVFSRVAGRFPVADLYAPLEAGDYMLLAGNPEAARPRYELESLRSLVLALEAAETTLGAVEANPEFDAFQRLITGRGLQTVALWLTIALVAVFLGWLTLRSAR